MLFVVLHIGLLLVDFPNVVGLYVPGFIMSFVTGIVVVPLPFTTSIVTPVKSASSPYFVAFVGCVFTFMFVTVSVTVYVYGTFTVVPFSVYSMSELLGFLKFLLLC